ncbi:MAG: DUF262 domain-containing protein [Bacteroidales bacterium]|nr:DUF262 domain-containing protein [Bacteroidales bacterium]
MDIKEKNKILAGTALFKSIFTFEGGYSIKIPDYQRPYVWNAEKVETLINDLQYHIEHNSGEPYYMGSILFFCQNGAYEIIDGQQRLTSLLILDKIANNGQSILTNYKEEIKFFFNSPISKKNIVDVKNYVNDYKTDWLQHNWNKVISDLAFSVIVTNRQDDAFSFFETQNNRGVKLGAADYLKSFHLRELREEERKQVAFAKQWDANNTNQFLNYLFNQVIWRGRSWKGSNVWYESQDDVLQEFQKKTRDPEIKNQVQIFPTVKNKIAHAIRYDETVGIMLDTSPIALNSHAINYPFALRQPIEKGIGFFLYSERYSAMYHFLFHTEHSQNSELFKFKEFYKAIYIYSGMSEYLTSLYRLSMVLYYDKFESEEIYKFAKYLDYFIGVYRVELSSIYDKSALKILKGTKQNLLDIISQAFIPKQVTDFIMENTNDAIFRDETIPLVKENGQLIYAVRSNYKRALLKYYEKEDQTSLKALKEWI